MASIRLKSFIIALIPALSGLIGKIALASSFALVWANELGINRPNFVFENVRMEIFVGCAFTLFSVYIFPNATPVGTLAPLIVLIPTMAKFGVHPLVLSIMVGMIGMVSIKSKLFSRLITLSGELSKTSLTLVFGISGILLAIQKLYLFFGNHSISFLLLLLILTVAYAILFIYKKPWLIIPIAALISLLFSWCRGMEPDIFSPTKFVHLNPFYWWEEMWGIGFGIDLVTILRTLPFAIFVILLWTVDTLSIQAVIGAELKEKKDPINIEASFMAICLRNIIGGFLGGAQTSSLWRSFLIPLYMMKSSLRYASFLLGMIGIMIAIAGTPIKILSLPPLVWSVLLFGIFIPFLITGIKKFKDSSNKAVLVLLVVLGIVFSPILTWVGAVLYEKIPNQRFLKR